MRSCAAPPSPVSATSRRAAGARNASTSRRCRRSGGEAVEPDRPGGLAPLASPCPTVDQQRAQQPLEAPRAASSALRRIDLVGPPSERAGKSPEIAIKPGKWRPACRSALPPTDPGRRTITAACRGPSPPCAWMRSPSPRPYDRRFITQPGLGARAAGSSAGFSPSVGGRQKERASLAAIASSAGRDRAGDRKNRCAWSRSPRRGRSPPAAAREQGNAARPPPPTVVGEKLLELDRTKRCAMRVSKRSRSSCAVLGPRPALLDSAARLLGASRNSAESRLWG